MPSPPTLPCTSCPGCCCGTIPISTARFRAVQKAARELPEEERTRLRLQKRRDLACGFYDVERNRCSVYHVRPVICHVYGHTEKLRCPMVPKNFVLTIKPVYADALIDADNLDFKMLTHLWQW